MIFAEKDRKNPAMKEKRRAGRMFAAVFAFFLILALPVCSVDVYADSVNYTGEATLVYTDDNGINWNCTVLPRAYLYEGPAIEISGCDGIDDAGTMTIPGEIDGYMVARIGMRAFKDNQEVKAKLKKLILPDSVTSIGDEAFLGCSHLETIQFSGNFRMIGEQAFRDCTSLRSPGLNDCLEYIGLNAFRNCDSFTEVNIPSGVSTIVSGAFSDCDQLTAFTVSEANEHYCASDGVLYNKDKSVLVIYPIAKSGNSFDIPASVTVVGAQAFQGSRLTSVVLNQGLKKIGNAAFSDMDNLKTVTFTGNSLESIGGGAFASSKSITKLEIPEGVKEIGDNAFSCCASLKTVSLPASLETLGMSAFYGAANLQEVTIPSDAALSAIKNYTFESCVSLVSFRIPDNVVSVERAAFQDCASLRSVYVPSSVTSIGDGSADDRVFSQCGIFLPNETFTVYSPAGSYVLTEYAENNSSISFAEASPEQYESIVAEYDTGSSGSGDSGNNESGGDQGGNGNSESGEGNHTKSAQTISVPSTTFSKTTNSKAFSLNAKAKTALSFSSSNEGIVSVDQKGVVTVKNPGTAIITITAAGDGEYMPASKKIKITVSLAAPSLKVKNVKTKKAKITWTKSQSADGYKIYVKGPKDKKFKCRISKNSKVKSTTHKGLKKGMIYKYKIRAYKIINGKYVYSPYSRTVTVKIKK